MKGEGSYDRALGHNPSHSMARTKTEICHLLGGIVISVNAEMVFVPTENDPFIRGCS